MLSNLNTLLELFYKMQAGDSLSVIEVFAVLGTVGAIAGSIWTIFSLTYLAVRISRSGFRTIFKPLGEAVVEAINLLRSENTELTRSNVLVSGLLTVILNDARRLFSPDKSQILMDGDSLQHITPAERKAILTVARYVRRDIEKQNKRDYLAIAAAKMRKANAVAEEEIKVDDKFLETSEILEMLRKRYGINISKNEKNCEADCVPF